MDRELLADVEKFAEENRAAILRDIARLVAVRSDKGEPEENAPFGAGPKKALETGLQIAAELGLETVNCNNIIGYAKTGEGEKYISTITHVDCVPTGEGWSGDPFTLREREGYIIGRGVADDKGPSVLCLYALKYLKDRGIPLRYEARALLGSNEETGMEDAEYYLANYEAPAFCFSPDADFPLIHGEKGITTGKLISACGLEKLVDIRGGLAVNAVPNKAEAWVRATGLKDAERITVTEENGISHITASGIGGHASVPKGTLNAIYVLIRYLLANHAVGEGEEKYLRFLTLFHEATDGSAIGVAAKDELFTPLTIVGGMIGVEDGHIVQTYDSRYPTSTSGEKIAAILRKRAGDTASVQMENDTVPFYMSLDNPCVQTCMRVYREVTGEPGEPFTIGGGTYARHFPNAVSFGPDHSDRPHPPFAGFMHGVDESARIDELIEALKVYILTFIELQNAEL